MYHFRVFFLLMAITISLSLLPNAVTSALADNTINAGSTKFVLGANIDLFAVSRNFGPANERRELLLREVEVSLEAQINPWLSGYIFLTRPEGEAMTVEEAAVIADLPWGWRLKAGDYRNEFGLLNTIHEPERPQISLPLPVETFLGEEQLREGSVTVGRTFTLGGTHRVGASLAILAADNEIAFNGGESGDLAYSGKFYYGHRSPQWVYQLGLSAATGKNDAAGQRTTNLQAVDFRITMDPDFNAGTDYAGRFTWLGEALFNQRELAGGDTNKARGFWTVANYQFRPGHHLGLGAEYSENLLDKRLKTRAYSAHYTWYYSPHARLQLQARELDTDGGESGLELMLQWNIVLRPHSEKPFLNIVNN